MTQATVVELAEAIVDELNQSSVQESLGVTFTAERVYTAEIKLEDTEKRLHVLVYPVMSKTDNAARSMTLKTPTINVGFVNRPPSDNTLQWIDGLVLAVERAGDYFRRRGFLMEDGERAVCFEALIDIPYDYEGLRQQKCFEAVLALSFKLGVQA